MRIDNSFATRIKLDVATIVDESVNTSTRGHNGVRSSRSVRITQHLRDGILSEMTTQQRRINFLKRQTFKWSLSTVSFYTINDDNRVAWSDFERRYSTRARFPILAEGSDRAKVARHIAQRFD